MKTKWICLILVGAVLLVTTAHQSHSSNLAADIIYTGGTIITINDSAPLEEVIAVKDGKILSVGNKIDVLKFKGYKTKLVDLDGKTLLPGFVDAHSHFSSVGMQAVSANLLPAPDGPVNSIPAMQESMRKYMKTSSIVKKYSVVIGFNYDDSQLIEKRHPTRQELDEISTETPVLIMHQSGHIGVYNSKALSMAGITAKTPNPAGGVIERESDGKTPSGVMQENAHFGIIHKFIPDFDTKDHIALFQSGEATYLANGFTTVQDGKTDLKTLQTMSEMSKDNVFKVDIVSYADIAAMGDIPILHGPLMSRDYTDGFRIGGVKLTFDGSPQGKTAWFSKPYFKVPAGQKSSYAGYPAFTDAEALKWYKLAYKNNWQMLTHANGDAAIGQLIKMVSQAKDAYPGTDRRTVLVHGIFMRSDQVKPLKELGIFPTLYPLHTFYWGDWHRESVAGPKRAENLAPTGWLLEQYVKFTIHSDAPVVFPNSMRILDSAVNRTTRSGYTLGAQQRISPMIALKAMTLWSAYQHFEENTKGSLEVGKLADFVILDKNPLTVSPEMIKNIKVLETIKEGKTIYLAQ